MRGSSNSVKCGLCHKTIEYLHSRISNITYSLVCVNCDQVPAVSSPAIDSLFNVPIEDFSPLYNVPLAANSRNSSLNLRVNRPLNPKIIRQLPAIPYQQPATPLSNLQDITCNNELIFPLPQTPKYFSPILSNSPTNYFEKPIDVISIEEALLACGLDTDDAIDLDALVNKEFERIGHYRTLQQSHNIKSLSPRDVFHQSPDRNSSPLPSTSSGMHGLNAARLRLSPHHHSSDSDIDDPAPLRSPTTLKSYFTDFKDFIVPRCDHQGITQIKRKVLNTEAIRSKLKKQKTSYFECSIQGCNQSYASIKSLWCHQDIVHLGKKRYICEFCGMGFVRSTNLTIHKRTHTSVKPYKCGKRFARSGDSRIHKRTHTGEKPFKCESCAKGFAQKSGLRVHERTHTGEKPFKCESCEKGFAQKSGLRVHELTHTGKKPLKCHSCGKRFAHKSDLIRHQHIHTHDKPFKCDNCNKGFVQKSDLKIHQRSHTGERPFLCEFCGMGFINISNLTRHQRTHLAMKPF